MLSLKTVSSRQKRKHKKRIGRGNASGTGTYAGRGLKGQRSRSGGKGGLKLRGLKATFKSVPKNKGFKSIQVKKDVTNVGTLDKMYEANSIVRLDTQKILGQGELTKSLTVYAGEFSKTAQEKIEQQGGKAIKCGKSS
ncbi:MAG: uL15 family ribosomal protein [bacterium]|nr:uL15 family ribosomal protein [bacterium]